MTTRRRMTLIALPLATGLLATACSGQGQTAIATVTQQVTVASSASRAVPAPATAHSQQPVGAPPATTTGTTGRRTGSSVPTSAAAKTSAAVKTAAAGGQPDGFVPTKLKAGQKAPQFIVVSFDGVGWHEKWQYYQQIAAKVPFHFTGFLTGLYLLSDPSKYQGPGHQQGRSSLGSWNTQAEVRQEITDLNNAYAQGNEIGSHFNGHFCSDNPPGSGDWSTADWNSEMDQYESFMTNYRTNNQFPPSVKLAFGPAEIKGERTPCLEGKPEQLFPAIKAHGMIYDSSFTRRGISWPTQSSQYKIWQMGMAEFPMHGTSHFQITMDYNFYFTQRNASSKGVTPAQSAADSAQVTATYQDMYNATTAGNRAPLILGNHFNAWNNDAYSQALGNFLLANCGKPNTYCVPFRDVIAWMKMQDPAVLAGLQNQAPQLGPPGA